MNLPSHHRSWSSCVLRDNEPARNNDHDANVLPELCRYTDTILLIRALAHPESPYDSRSENWNLSAHRDT